MTSIKEENIMKHWILGITGGVGCGKSAVLSILEKEYGAYVIQADIVAHELMEPGQTSYNAIVDHFGQDILSEDGHIDRKALGSIVFSNEEKLALLNSLTHPAVKQEIRNRIAESQNYFIVIEAALLLEDHYDEICDEIWYVYAEKEVRFERLAASRGYSREKSQAMMDNQMSEEELRRRCQTVIDNSGSLEVTRKLLESALQERRLLS
jgi:dephospho-CoA kinase